MLGPGRHRHQPNSTLMESLLFVDLATLLAHKTDRLCKAQEEEDRKHANPPSRASQQFGNHYRNQYSYVAPHACLKD